MQQQNYMAILINNGWETSAPAISAKNTAKQKIAGIEAAAAAAAAEGASTAAAAAGPGPSSGAGSRSAAGRSKAAAADGGGGGQAGASALVRRLAQLPLQQLCPKGFIFIWLHKEYVAGEQ
jgi:hypothetical protein